MPEGGLSCASYSKTVWPVSCEPLCQGATQPACADPHPFPPPTHSPTCAAPRGLCLPSRPHTCSDMPRARRSARASKEHKHEHTCARPYLIILTHANAHMLEHTPTHLRAPTAWASCPPGRCCTRQTRACCLSCSARPSCPVAAAGPQPGLAAAAALPGLPPPAPYMRRRSVFHLSLSSVTLLLFFCEEKGSGAFWECVHECVYACCVCTCARACLCLLAHMRVCMHVCARGM